MMLKREYELNSDSSDSDDDNFLIALAINVPKLRRYPDRPDILSKYTDIEFRERFRFSKETVSKLSEMFEPYLATKTRRCKSISTTNQLCIALRCLATGCFQTTSGDLFNCHKSTVCRLIPKVMEKIALLCRLNNIIKMPTTDRELFHGKLNFYRIAGFPGVIGAIGCTHIKIQISPGADIGRAYRNRKGYFSINVQCVSDAQLKICNIEARWPGSVNDQTILDKSLLNARFCRNEFGGGVLLGDGNYVNKNYLLTPLSNPQTTAEKKYQWAHIATRNTVEELFRAWKRRFPALNLGFRVKVGTILTSIVAAAVLHNLAIEWNDGFQDFPEVDIHHMDIQATPHNSSNNSSRLKLIDNHFNLVP